MLANKRFKNTDFLQIAEGQLNTALICRFFSKNDRLFFMVFAQRLKSPLYWLLFWLADCLCP